MMQNSGPTGSSTRVASHGLELELVLRLRGEPVGHPPGDALTGR
jgi:hypothetical protein